MGHYFWCFNIRHQNLPIYWAQIQLHCGARDYTCASTLEIGILKQLRFLHQIVTGLCDLCTRTAPGSQPGANRLFSFKDFSTQILQTSCGRYPPNNLGLLDYVQPCPRSCSKLVSKASENLVNFAAFKGSHLLMRFKPHYLQLLSKGIPNVN